MTRMPMPEELEALQKALSDALGELRVVRTERDLLKEQLNRFKRQLFDAKSEVSAAHQKDLFFNEAEIEGAPLQLVFPMLILLLPPVLALALYPPASLLINALTGAGPSSVPVR